MKKLLLAIACVASAGVAQAAVVNVDVTTPTTGSWEVYTGTGPIGTDQFNMDGVVYTMDEAGGVVLPTNLTTSTGVIAAGTTVDSTLIFVDPLNFINTQATIDFSGDILGIIIGTVGLALTDGLFGDTLTTYVYSFFTGLEAVDSVTIVDANTITINFWTSNPGDYIRVLTATAVPVPAAGLMLLAGLGALVMVRRRKGAALAA